MSKFEKLRQKIVEGRSDANIDFEDLRNFLLVLGFVERIKGSHHNFRKEGVAGNQISNETGAKRSHTKSGRFARLSRNTIYEER